ncbi:MAG: hypothetical protein OWR62_11145 [Sulfobacillus thermotolerans]|nr:hypothetical protein [Sulfobacillus thermotolerans]
MWFRRRPQVPLFFWFLALLGLTRVARVTKWSNMSDEQRAAYREKRHRFLQKLDDAYRVWDEPEDDGPASDQK